MNAALAKGREDLLAATCIFVTLGTAWVFRHREVCVLVGVRETAASGSAGLERKSLRFVSKLESQATNQVR